MSLVRLSLIAISLALIVWALVQMFAVPQDLAELEVRVENANLSLSGSEYVVQVYDAIDRSLVAEGDRSDKAVLLLAPGEYDVRVTVPGVWPTQVSCIVPHRPCRTRWNPYPRRLRIFLWRACAPARNQHDARGYRGRNSPGIHPPAGRNTGDRLCSR